MHISTVIGWGRRYGREGEAGPKARWRGRRYLTGRTLSLSQEWQVRSILGGDAGATGAGFCVVEPAGGDGTMVLPQEIFP